MAKLERLAMLAKRKSLFDDKSTEVNELTFVVKQNLANLNQQISDLQSLTRQQTGKTEEGEHQKNVVFLLQDRLTGVSGNFKDVLEVRTKNLQATRARTDNFISQVSQNVAPLNPAGLHAQSSSPFYHASTPGSASAGRNTPILDGSGGSLTSAANNGDAVLSLNPVSDQQQMLMEEAQPINMYTQERGEAIEAIQSTIAELGSIFGQLASMVTEQSEMIERIDANAEDVVDNVEGAQKQLLKYWGRVSSNRWLIAKMFGVLMIFFLLWVLIAG